jgi:hypothetical protein
LTIIQLLISKRGYDVNQALIKTIAEFENKNSFTLLNDFNNNLKMNKKSIKIMNFPSLAIIMLNIIFLILWMAILSVNLKINNYFVSFLQNINSISNSVNVNLIIYGIFFGVTMKISDLLNEHGKHWFKCDKMLFSVLCGISGGLIIFSDIVAAHVVLAMIVGFVLRKKIDYFNHAIAFLILISCFLFFINFNISLYLYFLFSFLLLGFIKELKYIKNKSKLIKIVNKIYIYIPIIYTIPTLIYSIYFNNWVIFLTFVMFDISYNLVRWLGETNLSGYYK